MTLDSYCHRLCCSFCLLHNVSSVFEFRRHKLPYRSRKLTKCSSCTLHSCQCCSRVFLPSHRRRSVQQVDQLHRNYDHVAGFHHHKSGSKLTNLSSFPRHTLESIDNPDLSQCVDSFRPVGFDSGFHNYTSNKVSHERVFHCSTFQYNLPIFASRPMKLNNFFLKIIL